VNLVTVAKKQEGQVSDGHILEVLSWRETEAELLDLARAGAPSFAARFYDRYALDVNRVIFKLLGSDAEHDDLVHDAFLQAIKAIHQVREPDRLKSWLISIAVNTVYAELRRRRRSRFWSRESAWDVPAVERGADHEARQRLRQVYQVLEALPLDERQVFALRHLDERQLTDVASAMGRSLSTIKRLLSKAEQRFKSLAEHRFPGLMVESVGETSKSWVAAESPEERS